MNNKFILPVVGIIFIASFLLGKWLNQSDDNLVQFCRNELTGWSITTPPEDKSLDYRLAEAFYAPLVRTNPSYWGWGGSSSNMFLYMEQHPDEFYPVKTLISMSISELEQKQKTDPEKSFMSWTQPLSDFIPDTEYPDHQVNCYARADTFERVVEVIRVELTKRLLTLLPYR